MAKVICPDDWMIAPCTCGGSGIDCSAVESDEQLAKVFQHAFPSPFIDGSFKLLQNSNIKVLRSGVFGEIYFTDFDIEQNPSLVFIEEGVILNSDVACETMNLQKNNLNSFPFYELAPFINLTILELGDNNLTSWPLFPAMDSLKSLTLSGNPLPTDMPSGVFQPLYNLENIYLHNLKLTTIAPGTFDNLWKLNVVMLSSGNHFKSLPAGLFNSRSPRLSWLDFWGNDIQDVDQHAFPVLNQGYTINLHNNKMSILKEGVWRPLMENGVELRLIGNPLECDCGMAWLITDGNMMGKIETGSTCSTGQEIHSLNPEDFIDC
ncbi:unnamed protein product [Meganyctiphanes norvegica]|uniref:Uncharacterized protein n=1 Tax=Meganyctiphanes norvegica TaxID=48144 RepID=A0AAV2RZH9_MEGNR